MRLATASLLIGLVSFLAPGLLFGTAAVFYRLFWPGGITGLALGIVALIRASRDAGGSKGFAIAAVLVNVLSIVPLGGLLITVTTLLDGRLSVRTEPMVVLAGIVSLALALLPFARTPGSERSRVGVLPVAWIVSSCLVIILASIGSPSGVCLLSYMPGYISEAEAIYSVRAVITAQASYRSSNSGAYAGDLTCLSAPERCIPGYKGSPFLNEPPESLASRLEYRRLFFPGPSVSADGRSVAAYAYVAVPIAPGPPGDWDGVTSVENWRPTTRAFCGDARRTICATEDGRAPTVRDGECDLTSCTALQ